MSACVMELTARGAIPPTPAVTYRGDPFTATSVMWTLYPNSDGGSPLAVTTLLDADYTHSASDHSRVTALSPWPTSATPPPGWFVNAARALLRDALVAS